MPHIKLNYFAVSIIAHILIIFGGSILLAEKEIAMGKESKSYQSGISLTLLNIQPKAAVIENVIPPENIIPPVHETTSVSAVEEKIVSTKKAGIKKIKSTPIALNKPEKQEQQPKPFQNTDKTELPLTAYKNNLHTEIDSPSISDVNKPPLVKNIYETPVALKFGENNGPRFKSRVNPNYPPRALRMKKEAQVTLRLTIDAGGQLLKTEVDKSGGIDFDNAAIEAMQKSTFQAAQHMGFPIPSVGLLKIDFVIKKNNKGML